MSTKGTIRFEDLGEPVQRLLKSLKSGISEDDMALLEHVSVLDMAKIYSEMAVDNHAERIWMELRAALQERQELAMRRKAELLKRQEVHEAEEQQRREQEAIEEENRRRAEEERQRRREMRRKRREEQLAAEEAALLAEQEAAEEEAARQEEENWKLKEERRRRRREAREQALREEQERLAAEEAKEAEGKLNSQKAAWEEYVANHPLEFVTQNEKIEQKRVEHRSKEPPKVNKEYINRVYTPKCQYCNTKYSMPPPLWDCTVCFRRTQQRFKVWQPDNASNTCMVCHEGFGWFSRHHCRNCGRLVCTRCSTTNATIPSVGFKEEAVKICDECARDVGTLVGVN
ncbi:FYVE zinc finger [Trypanosoma vivax]|nr:putative zinc finger protein [Trypanosoma vivax]KAH8604205.1 FYVE zinc finger [Trypanosoma vivax]